MSAAAFAPEVRLAGHGALRLGARSRHVLDAPGRPVLVLLTLAGATAAGVSIASALTGGRLAAPGVQAALMAWITLAYVLSGAAAAIGLLVVRRGDPARPMLARSAVGDLFVELRGNVTSAGLGAALARALGDPSLRLAHWRPERESWVDEGGRPVELPDGDGAGAATLVERNGHPVAALLHDASLCEEPELLDAVVAAVAIALENEQLHAESETRLAELQASRQRIVAVGDAERRRIERDLHDGAQQRLVALALQLRLAHAHIRRDPAAAEELVTSATDQLRQSLEELRELARGIHPAVLEYGLPSALDSLAACSAARTVVSCNVTGRLPRPVELALYFVASEALANVGKYASATAVSLRLWRDETVVAIEIADDGVGGADASAGSGLRGLADRVEALDGVLLVSSPPGGGTVIRAELPG